MPIKGMCKMSLYIANISIMCIELKDLISLVGALLGMIPLRYQES